MRPATSPAGPGRRAPALLAALWLLGLPGGAGAEPRAGEGARPRGDGAAGGEPSAELTRDLVARIDAMKEEIARRDKTVEILLAFGNLYYQSQRYLDAIDWYRQAIEASEPGWRSWRALAASARAAGPSAAARARCARTGSRQYRELAREAAALERAGAAADAAWCWRAALGPALEARVRRAAAFLLAGNPDLARAELRSVLADEPRNPEALRLLRQAGSGADSAR